MNTVKASLKVVKIGGNLIDDASALSNFLKDYSALVGPKILVHGGGKKATEVSDRLGFKSKLLEGRRVTSTEELEVVTMVYAGLINKHIVAQLQQQKCNAIGLSGVDANLIQAKIRPKEPIDFGWVGDVTSVNTSMIQYLISTHLVPVFCAISHNGNGQLLNTNADTVAAEIAIALSQDYEVELIYCFEKNGVLRNVEDENSVITHINYEDYEQLKNKKIIHEGMLPKIQNCFHALNNGVKKVKIGNAAILQDASQIHTTLIL